MKTFKDLVLEKKLSKKRKSQKKRTAKGKKRLSIDKKLKSKLAAIVKKNIKKGKK